VSVATVGLLDAVRRIVREELAAHRTAELAIVQELHPHADAGDADNYACTVRLRDTGLVLRRVPVATPRLGTVAIPAEGDLVLVQFVGGDLNAPVVVGSLYNDEDRPPPSGADTAVLHLPLGAGDADAVHLELRHGDTRELTLRLGNGLTLALRDDDPVVEVDVAGKASLTFDRDGALTVRSNGNVTLEGSEVRVEARGTLTLKGATVNIN
jgi:phage baseplate assembly protein gpV